MNVKFSIPGPAQAKQRPRINRQTGRVYTPNATHKYEKLVKECYGDRHFFDSQYISVKITFKFSIPKSYSKAEYYEALIGEIRPKKADIDNYIKSVLDGLNGVAFTDDRYICHLEAEKIYTEGEAETIVEINSMKTN